MLPLAQAGLTVPAVAGRGLNEWLGVAAPKRLDHVETGDLKAY